MARKGEVPVTPIVQDLGLRRQDGKAQDCRCRTYGIQAGTAVLESAEMREMKKPNRLLGQENDILRPAAAHLA
ncbi:hypothetical protein CXX84_18900 [Arthrobacter sp. AFG7.2]|nr:hypothetical protein CXX84_18900 [Arthrobacter sp. AFG7.2]